LCVGNIFLINSKELVFAFPDESFIIVSLDSNFLLVSFLVVKVIFLSFFWQRVLLSFFPLAVLLVSSSVLRLSHAHPEHNRFFDCYWKDNRDNFFYRFYVLCNTIVGKVVSVSEYTKDEEYDVIPNTEPEQVGRRFGAVNELLAIFQEVS